MREEKSRATPRPRASHDATVAHARCAWSVKHGERTRTELPIGARCPLQIGHYALVPFRAPVQRVAVRICSTVCSSRPANLSERTLGGARWLNGSHNADVAA